ncbi:hypothetical protein M885DRAFT_591485 [Pelagophyceae sp. CCMP2097]|nr:hypothetical protein M885DRAFT_591485 [Pelagophyceae sp. CCMP2097]
MSSAAAAPAVSEEQKKKKAERKEAMERERAAGGEAPAKAQLTKAERRDIQERQRAAKAAAQDGGPAPPAAAKASSSPAQAGAGRPPAVPKLSLGGAAPAKPAHRSSAVLAHLAAHSSDARKVSLSNPDLHPAIVSLGLRYSSGACDGANTRCVAILAALKEAIKDYILPPGVAISRDLDKKLRPMIQYLIDCRPHSASMGHAIKHVRGLIANLPPDVTLNDAKQELCEAMDRYVHERIVLPGTVIAERGIEKIRDGDVVMTYASSDAVSLLLAKAKRAGRRFRVVLVDSRPLLEGRKMLTRLHALGIDVTYVWLHAIAYACREVTKVVLGADALLSNGACLARAGTASVAMTASQYNIPVLVCCETYKFHDRVQLDSVCSNELGDPDSLKVASHPDDPTLENPPHRLHLRFDVTPPKYVSVIVTEHGLVPPSACAVLIRELAQNLEATEVA